MVSPEFLSGGVTRLRGAHGAFLLSRLQPGVIVTSFRGKDTGEFGTQVLDHISTEHRYFAKPVEWFFDATLVDDIAGAVSSQWVDWMRKNRSRLSRMHVLTAGDETRLRMGIARHFSGLLKEMVLYTDRAKWEQASGALVAGFASDLSQGYSAPALEISATRSRLRGYVCEAAESRWSFRSLSNAVVLTSFSGNDDGALTDLALAEMQSLVDASASKKTSWFLDLRQARNVAPRVSQTWTAWLSAHHEKLARVSAL